MYDESLDPQIQFRNFIKNEAPTADDVNVEYYEYRNNGRTSRPYWGR